MKAKLYFVASILMLLLTGTLLKAQENDFKIGIVAGGQINNSNGYVTSVNYPVGTTKYSSVFGIPKEDGPTILAMVLEE
jgi:hypothetical protein